MVRTLANMKRGGTNTGLGRIKCKICGLPTRDHQVGQHCPLAPEGSVSQAPSTRWGGRR